MHLKNKFFYSFTILKHVFYILTISNNFIENCIRMWSRLLLSTQPSSLKNSMKGETYNNPTLGLALSSTTPPEPADRLQPWKDWSDRMDEYLKWYEVWNVITLENLKNIIEMKLFSSWFCCWRFFVKNFNITGTIANFIKRSTIYLMSDFRLQSYPRFICLIWMS